MSGTAGDLKQKLCM